MTLPPQITFHGVTQSDAIADYIAKRAEKLDTFYDRIQSCRVAVEAPHKHKHEGRPYRIRVDLAVPGSEIAVSRDSSAVANEDVYAAIDAAFDDAQRRLQDYARLRRGDVKVHEEQSKHGNVTKLFPQEGYGFLQTEEGDELYFHRNSVLNEAWGRMQVGARVRYVEAEGDDGLHASTVVLLRNPNHGEDGQAA
jgi:ribosomal subunit interface protein